MYKLITVCEYTFLSIRMRVYELYGIPIASHAIDKVVRYSLWEESSYITYGT